MFHVHHKKLHILLILLLFAFLFFIHTFKTKSKHLNETFTFKFHNCNEKLHNTAGVLLWSSPQVYRVSQGQQIVDLSVCLDLCSAGILLWKKEINNWALLNSTQQKSNSAFPSRFKRSSLSPARLPANMWDFFGSWLWKSGLNVMELGHLTRFPSV